jgi:RHS repeat-associated protein
VVADRRGSRSDTMRAWTKRLANGALVALMALASQSALALKCDVDANGRIDRVDLTRIQQAVLAKSPVTGPDDPRDADNDNVITSSDGRICALRCTYASCATNGAPVANAGPDQTARVGDTVTLNGAGSSDPDGNALRYQWTLSTRPAGSAAALSSATAVNPTFVADRRGSYVAQLVVNDGSVNSVADTVTISTVNSAPVAHAGDDQSGRVGDAIVLDGRRSSDVDGDALSYAWRIVAAPAGSAAALSSASAVQPGFTIDVAGTYEIELVVNDGTADSAADRVVVSTTNSAPVARPGNNRAVALGATVQLDGSGSSDVDGNALTYAWSLLSRPAGSSAVLSSASAVNPTFVADVPGSYVAQLIVNDGLVNSAAASVTISTDNAAPSANAGPDQTVPLGAQVQLNGAGSSDPEGAALGYAWSITGRPAGSVAVLDVPNAVNPRFTADRAGNYVVQLIVSDGALSSAPDTVVISTENSRPVANAGPAQAVNTGATVQLDGSGSSDADGEALTYAWSLTAPAGSAASISPANAVNPSFVADVAGSYVAQLIVSDGRLASVPATVLVTATTPNRAPVAVAAATPASVNVGATVTLSSAGSSDPDGNALTYAWSLAARPGGSAAGIANATAADASFVPDVAGVYTVQLTVSDGALSHTALATVTAVSAANTAPTAVADRYATTEELTLTVPAASGVLANDTDPEGNVLSAELVATTTHGALTLQADGGLRYVPALGFAGIDRFTYRARDAGLASAPVSVEIVVSPAPDVLPLDLDLTVNPAVVAPGGSVTITVLARGGRAPVVAALRVDGLDVALNPSGQAVLTNVAAGVHRVQASVTDAQSSVQKDGLFSGQVAADTAAPVAAITAPAANAEIFGAVNIVGTANDVNLAEYRLLRGPAGSAALVEFARGTAAVVNGVLGRLDITTIPNGLTDVVLEVRDVNGAVTRAKVTVEVVGDQKVGNFSITFEDLNVEAAGIPISVTRTYSTARRGERLDFGYGWSVDYQNLKLQTNGVLGSNWTLSSSGFIIRTYCLRPNGRHTVSVTLPDGKVERFDMTVTPECTSVIPPVTVDPVFTARSGTRSKLTSSDGGLYVAGTELLDLGTGGSWDPTSFTLTTEDNFVYQLDKNFGVRSVRDPSGNTLTYSSNGIVHSGGQSVLFARDAQGRITRITDPSGKAIEYQYNVNGDLATVTDRVGQAARHRYNRSHGLVDFTDPRGVQLARNVYDDEGRLIEQYDAAGNKVAIISDTAAQRQTVRDRRGFATAYDYDASGNVTRSVDAKGGVTLFGYDARGNEQSVTDALGRTTTRSFGADDRLLSVADPLGQTTSFAYDASGQPIQITDPSGRRVELTYAANGSPTQIKDAAGAATAMAYDARGNLTQVTDPMGRITRYGYDAAGRRISETDALGRTTTIGYDANGRETSRSTSRTHEGAAVAVTTSRVLDANGNLLQEVDAEGHTETRTYNALGKLATLTDKLGQTTRYEYDSRGQLSATQFPDGTTESVEYDPNGNEIARTDRAGRRTSYVYDELNRLVQTIRPDGSELRKEYDAAGQVLAEIDGRGNRTTFEYDAAGRRTRLVDAGGYATETEFDGAGNIVKVTDARGNVTRLQYDAANRRTATILPDGSSTSFAYDAAGRKIRETDQAGHATVFEYDGADRLIAVTDPMGGVTRFTYDELGNKLTQQDAAGRITRWTYDNIGRVTRRTLPGGQSETFAYDALGNRTTHVDFKGATTRFTYDTDGRLVGKLLPDGRNVRTTYTPTGMPSVVTDSRGETRHAYDPLDRLVEVRNPNGSVLRYTYDAAGNRLTLAVQQGARPARTTAFAYDALNRLARVVDPEGGVTTFAYDQVGNRASATLPNGTRATYTYDALNRLTLLEHTRVADGSLLARFAYTLSVNGQRVRAVETVAGNTRSVEYSYDAYQRLLREVVADPAGGNRDLAYTYDAVGNRLTKTADGAVTNYAYDANDRLITESGAGVDRSYAYDANGNTVEKRAAGNVVASYAWDAENRLIGASEGGRTAAYAYDAGGQRVSKTLDGQIVHYTVDRNLPYAEVVEERDESGNLIVGYVHGDDLIKQLRGGQATYYHADGQGSIRMLSNAAGDISDTWHYDAFGNELGRTGTTVNDYRFVGEPVDANTGFYYLRARWMNPEVGRFASLDTFPGFARDPASLHKYLYANGDPVNRLDPSGNMSLGGLAISFSIQINLAVSRIGAQFLISRAVGGAALRSLGVAVESAVGTILRSIPGLGVRQGVGLVGQGGRRVLDFWLTAGNRVAVLEVKYGLPRAVGPALTRLVGQLRTAATAEEAVRNGAQVVLFTFRAPTVAQMALLESQLGASAGFVQHVSGLLGLIQWVRLFFLLPI